MDITIKVLNTWVKFIKSPEVVDMKDANKAVKEAKQVLEEISQDEKERYRAELRDSYVREHKTALSTGYNKGFKAGSINIAKKLKEENIDINIISETTGLSIEEIQKL